MDFVRELNNNMLNAVFVTVGYPTHYRPNDGIFTHRMVKKLANVMNVKIAHIRAIKPGRPLVEERMWDGIHIHSVCVPQIPALRYALLNARLLAWFGLPTVKKMLNKADVIHSTGIYTTGYAASLWARSLDKPHVTQAIGSDVNILLADPKLSGTDRRWMEAIDGVSCNSRRIRDRLLELAPHLPNVRVIYRGVDPERFQPQGHIEGPQVGLPPVRFLYLGGFQTWDPALYDEYNVKGGHVLLEAWRRVESTIGQSSLVIGGTGINPSRLSHWHNSLQRADSVCFTNVVTPEVVPGMVRACDVVVIPRLNEGLPNLANETQACGRPVLGSDAGGIPESVIQGRTGLIVARGDVDALAEGMRWFFKHQDEIDEMGMRGRQHMIENFNPYHSAEEMLTLLRVAMDHHSKESR